MKHLTLIKLKDEYNGLLLEPDKTFVYFGEIPQMPEHCVVAGTRTGKLYIGYHTDNFVELAEDEV